MNRFLKIVSSVSVLSVALAMGGTAMADAAPAAPQAAAQEAHHGHHGRGGGLLHAALSLSTLRADQRTQIQQLVDQEKAAHATVRAARGDLMEAVARGVESGRVDDAAMKPKVDAIARAMANSEPAERAALEKLHTILDASQRAELVNGIEARHQGHARPEGGRGEQAKGEHRGGGLGHWAKDLSLTPQQAEQIRTNLQKERAANPPAEHGAKGEHGKILEAFKGNRFVMNELAPPADPAKATRGAERIIDVAQAAVPVLTPAQRTAAAAKLRAEAQKGAAHAK